MKKTVLFILASVFVLFLISTQITLFVIQPIGAVPEGKTLVIPRTGEMNFIESADAICERKAGGVSILCRGMALAQISKSKIYLRLPYNETLYLISTDGKRYSK
jgi:hypothetical protein